MQFDQSISCYHWASVTLKCPIYFSLYGKALPASNSLSGFAGWNSESLGRSSTASTNSSSCEALVAVDWSPPPRAGESVLSPSPPTDDDTTPAVITYTGYIIQITWAFSPSSQQPILRRNRSSCVGTMKAIHGLCYAPFTKLPPISFLKNSVCPIKHQKSNPAAINHIYWTPVLQMHQSNVYRFVTSKQPYRFTLILISLG